MIVGKIVTLNTNQPQAEQIRILDKQQKNIITALQGRLRFGDAADNEPGENIQGEFQSFTSDATPNTEFSVAHSLGAAPLGRIVLWQDKAGALYQGPATGTAWDATDVYFKCDVASVAFLVFLIK
jgi:hypothetical protein